VHSPFLALPYLRVYGIAQKRTTAMTVQSAAGYEGTKLFFRVAGLEGRRPPVPSSGYWAITVEVPAGHAAMVSHPR
jgi:hypothetical protein